MRVNLAKLRRWAKVISRALLIIYNFLFLEGWKRQRGGWPTLLVGRYSSTAIEMKDAVR
jgi:hypothetical protein